jgi:hypothetical protein
VALDATAAANADDGPPADAAGAPDPVCVAPDIAQTGAGDSAAEDAPFFDEPLASAVIRDDAATDNTANVNGAPPCAGATPKHDVESAADDDIGAWLRTSSQWTPPTLRYIPSRASPRDAVLRRHQNLAPLQPELRCRDLGTLGPRGPPASQRV